MNFLGKYQLQLLSILRIVTALLFLGHGVAKLFHFPHIATFDHLPPLLLAAGIIEVFGGSLVLLGLFTRIAAFICSGEMAVAYWTFHVGRSGQLLPILNQGELAIMFCFAFLYIAAAGPGPWAISRR